MNLKKTGKNKIILVNKETGKEKKAKVGISWTVLFFSYLVPLFRLDWKWLLIMFAGGTFLPLVWDGVEIFEYYIPGMFDSIVMRVNLGIIFNGIMVFFYNKLYIADLLRKGYEPAGDRDREILMARGFTI